jgi:hypothetical protein
MMRAASDETHALELLGADRIAPAAHVTDAASRVASVLTLAGSQQ